MAPGLVQIILGGPGHLSRDSGTKKPDSMYVGLGLQERALHVTPGRWRTLTGLAWVAALITAIMTFATAVLAAMGRDVSYFWCRKRLHTRAWGACCWPGGLVIRWVRCFA